MNKGLEVLEELKNDLTPMHFSRIEKLDRYKIIEKEINDYEKLKADYEQLKKVMNKYDIKSVEELEHVILNDATGEQTFRDYIKPYKDIEEELGIDLVTLFKAANDGIWYNGNGTLYFNHFDISLVNKCFRRYIDYFKDYLSFDFKDYGKTWALTREELL